MPNRVERLKVKPDQVSAGTRRRDGYAFADNLVILSRPSVERLRTRGPETGPRSEWPDHRDRSLRAIASALRWRRGSCVSMCRRDCSSAPRAAWRGGISRVGYWKSGFGPPAPSASIFIHRPPRDRVRIAAYLTARPSTTRRAPAPSPPRSTRSLARPEGRGGGPRPQALGKRRYACRGTDRRSRSRRSLSM